MARWIEGHEGDRLTTVRSAALLEVHLAHGSVNALDARTYREIHDVFMEVDSTPSVGVVLLRGRNDCFSAGQDIEDAPQIQDDPAGYLLAAAESLAAVTRSSALVVAGVRRFAVGAGLILATSADLLVVDSSARLFLPELQHGVAAGVAHVSWWLGEPAAQRALATGRRIDPLNFAQAGAEVVQSHLVEASTRELVDALVRQSASYARMTKAASMAARHNLAERYLDEIRTTIAAGLANFTPAPQSEPPHRV